MVAIGWPLWMVALGWSRCVMAAGLALVGWHWDGLTRTNMGPHWCCSSSCQQHWDGLTERMLGLVLLRWHWDGSPGDLSLTLSASSTAEMKTSPRLERGNGGGGGKGPCSAFTSR